MNEHDGGHVCKKERKKEKGKKKKRKKKKEKIKKKKKKNRKRALWMAAKNIFPQTSSFLRVVSTRSRSRREREREGMV
jgi:hypothetical protein